MRPVLFQAIFSCSRQHAGQLKQSSKVRVHEQRWRRPTKLRVRRERRHATIRRVLLLRPRAMVLERENHRVLARARERAARSQKRVEARADAKRRASTFERVNA